MRTEDADFERVSPWMRKYVRDGTDLFIKLPKNDGHYYFGLFILMLAAFVALTLAILATTEGEGSFYLHFALSPFVAFYAGAMFLWCRFGRIEISLGNQLAKRTKILQASLGLERWHWNEIHDVWTQNADAGVADKPQDYRGSVFIKFNRDRQEVLSNLTFEEAECLHQAIANRLQPRGIG